MSLDDIGITKVQTIDELKKVHTYSYSMEMILNNHNILEGFDSECSQGEDQIDGIDCYSTINFNSNEFLQKGLSLSLFIYENSQTLLKKADIYNQHKTEVGVIEKILSTFKFTNNSKLVGIYFPNGCKVVGSKGDKDISGTGGNVLGESEWLVDCGKDNNNARGVMGRILESQGWKFCDAQTATSNWWKDGVITGVAESAGVSYPFRIRQDKSGDIANNCQ